MCGVVDTPCLFPVEIKGDQQENDGEKKGGEHDRDKHDSHEIHRIDQHIGENYGRNCSGSAETPVSTVVLLFEIGWKDGYGQ